MVNLKSFYPVNTQLLSCVYTVGSESSQTQTLALEAE